MRGFAECCVCVTMAVGLISCGGGDSSGSGGGPSPTPQSLTITPGTTILKVDQTEVFSGTVNPLNLQADGNRMSGTFTVAVTAAGASGQGLFTAEILTVARVASGLAPTATGASTLDLTAFMRRLRR